MSRPDATGALAALPGLPRDAGGPVFREPWHAQAFAMAVALNERGLFTWSEWADVLGTEIKRTGGTGEDAYYSAWLSALERMLDARGLVPEAERAEREAAWDRAARATPHGEPIELGRERSTPRRSARLPEAACRNRTRRAPLRTRSP